jgi:glycosyltransferase involved in cell wall biosynthesis
LKTIARWFLKGDHLSSYSYLWKGQRTCIKEILLNAKMILPNSALEYQRLLQAYACRVKHHIITNGVDPDMFVCNNLPLRINNLVLCVARIEGIKNQLNLIKALNNTSFQLILIGSPSPNQVDYYKECKIAAMANIRFIDHLPQHELITYYQKAKVHILPSWFETTGLSSLEAAAMGCNVVITDKGDAKEYFKDNAFYCDPARPESILSAVRKASQANFNDGLRKTILNKHTWKQTAQQTLQAYQTALAS